LISAMETSNSGGVSVTYGGLNHAPTFMRRRRVESS
jgi:hypothetical protein